MGKMTAWMDRRFYPKHRANWDDWLFRERILAHVKPGTSVLDLGAGAGIVEQMDFRGLGARICGVDLPGVGQHRHRAQRTRGAGARRPLHQTGLLIFGSRSFHTPSKRIR